MLLVTAAARRPPPAQPAAALCRGTAAAAGGGLACWSALAPAPAWHPPAFMRARALLHPPTLPPALPRTSPPTCRQAWRWTTTLRERWRTWRPTSSSRVGARGAWAGGHAGAATCMAAAAR